MDKSKIYVGLILKSYAALCRLVGEEPKTGSSRPAQEKRLKRYLNWEKHKGNSLIITEIYEERQPKPLRQDDKYGYDILTCLKWDCEIVSETQSLTNQDAELMQTYTLNQILALCGFVSCQWATNSDKLRNSLREYEKAGTPVESSIELSRLFSKLDRHIKEYCGNAIDRSLNVLLRDEYLKGFEKRRWVLDGKESRRATRKEEQICAEIEDAVKKALNIWRITYRNGPAYYSEFNRQLKKRTGLDGTWILREVTIRSPFEAVTFEEYLEARERINQQSIEQFLNAAKHDMEKEALEIAEKLKESEDEMLLEVIDLFKITPEEVYISKNRRIEDEIETRNALVSWFVELDGAADYQMHQ